MENKKQNSVFKSIMLVVITAIISCSITAIVVYSYAIMQTDSQLVPMGQEDSTNSVGTMFLKVISNLTGKKKVDKSLNSKLSEIKSKVDDIYIGDIDEKKMQEGALEGYVAALGDEYTEYLTEDEVEALMQDVNGSYVGVGLYIAQNAETNEIIVVGVIEDSPANKAGILVGDIVKKVDNVEYTGENLTEASSNMKGKEGTKVKVTVVRDNEEIDFNIIREKIKFKCVKSELLDNKIGYIKISSFDGGCADDFKRAYQELSSKGINSLIIDLRNNGGGLVDQSLDIAEMIVPKGSKMLITTDKSGKEEDSISKKDPIINVPIAILVNEYTASASEILTAAIRENTNATVIGTQTFGKGIIQGIFLFDDEKTGMKITMQEYFTPKHNKLHKIGIKPDIELELPDEWKGHLNINKEDDNQLNKAIEVLKK